MKSIPYILYSAALAIVAYLVVRHELSTPPPEERHADYFDYDDVSGRFHDPITHEEVYPEFDD